MGQAESEVIGFRDFYEAQEYYDEEDIDIDSADSDAKSDDSWNYRTNTKKVNKKALLGDYAISLINSIPLR